MRISEKFIRIGLILMVALSLYFSYAIWLSPAGKTSINMDESNAQVIESQSYRKASEVFLPLHVTWFQEGTIKETNSENLITRLQTIVENARFGKLSEVVAGDHEKFDQVRKLTSGFEFAYNAPFLLSEYQEAFQLNLDLSDSMKNNNFTRIQFDKKNNKIRFINYPNRVIYEANVSINWEDLDKELNVTGIKWTEMSNEPSELNNQYNTKQSIKLKKYSYILSQQPYTLFRNAFFQKPDKVKNNAESNELIFYGDNETMSIHSENQVVDFRGESAETEEEQSVFSASFPYISKLGSALGNLRYFDRENNKVDYRIFVEGFPVFGSDSKGQVGIEVAKEASGLPQVNIQTSLNTIQVPIPSDEEVELASTGEIIQQLVSKGAEKTAIESVIVGYTWQNIKETNRVVDLLPEWYVKYQDKWYSANELLDQLPGLEAK
ncbi:MULTISPECIES: two-component system activity regulator YycH [unclassified Enterococcus]|uniref:YycH family regulatory protein n=1 Tax=unclassified Enterococcus TaxID=2608891 RepID=UPI0013EA62DF|nr:MULTISPECIES: two-component system activity regulator YycH [unclassified Enterococcus]